MKAGWWVSAQCAGRKQHARHRLDIWLLYQGAGAGGGAGEHWGAGQGGLCFQDHGQGWRWLPDLGGVQQGRYSRLTLVVTFWEASHISPNNTFSLFLTLYIVSHTPRAFPICEKKFHRFSLRNLWTSKWKIYFLHQKVVTHFFDFIGFMVVKTTGLTSGLTSLLQFWKQCTVVRDIYESLIYFFYLFY